MIITADNLYIDGTVKCHSLIKACRKVTLGDNAHVYVKGDSLAKNDLDNLNKVE